MRNVIVPVDFSETSLNAARYTAKMMAGKNETTVILYHNYDSEDDFELDSSYDRDLFL